MTMLFSFRGRVTRAECFMGVLAWLAVFGFGGILAGAAMRFGHPWAGCIYVAVALSGMVSLQALLTRRAHDTGRGYWSALLNPFSLLKRGTAGPNAYGAAPPHRRVWWFLVALVLIISTGSRWGAATSAATPSAPSAHAPADDLRRGPYSSPHRFRSPHPRLSPRGIVLWFGPHRSAAGSASADRTRTRIRYLDAIGCE
jgi:uncharacterized membrane protein YhaH (DUF805 family)